MYKYLGLIILILLIITFIGVKWWLSRQKHYHDIANGGSGVGTEVTKPNNTNNETQSN
jgi:hypothetical protein